MFLVNKLIAKTFENRGIECPEAYMSEINNPEHDSLKDIDVLCTHLHNIYESHKHIVILPDFDTDGIMSGVIGFAGLSELGFRVSLFVPDPADGYGFTPDTIKRLLDEYPDVDAILTCDVGVSCLEGIDYAVTQGVEVLVTDHHIQSTLSADTISANVVVNPMRVDESYEHPQICGAYVLYQCLQRYADCYHTALECEQINRLRVFAGVGTISDSMPILYENRQLVRDAVNICRLFFTGGSDFAVNAVYGCQTYCRAFYGLTKILDMFSDTGVVLSSDDITESFFGYYLAPMLNSVKRLCGDMSKAFGVFFGSDVDNDICYLYDLNRQRKNLVKDKFNEIYDGDQPFAPYIYISDAPSGILGLLAMKIMNKTGLPTVVVSEVGTSYKGSGRSPLWYPFLTTVTNAQNVYVAGHEHAFGVDITDISELEQLYDFLSNDVSNIIEDNPDIITTEPVYDFVIATDGSGDINIDLFLFGEYLGELEWYQPFGVCFSEPVIKLRFRASEGVWSVMGSTKQHLKILLPHGFEVLCFNQASFINMADAGGMVEVIGHLSANEFNGHYTINFIGEFKKES